MVRRAFDLPRAAEEDAAGREEKTRRERVSIRQTLEQLGEARCPLCRMVLVARLGRAGPQFFCRCPSRGC